MPKSIMPTIRKLNIYNLKKLDLTKGAFITFKLNDFSHSFLNKILILSNYNFIELKHYPK